MEIETGRRARKDNLASSSRPAVLFQIFISCCEDRACVHGVGIATEWRELRLLQNGLSEIDLGRPNQDCYPPRADPSGVIFRVDLE